MGLGHGLLVEGGHGLDPGDGEVVGERHGQEHRGHHRERGHRHQPPPGLQVLQHGLGQGRGGHADADCAGFWGATGGGFTETDTTAACVAYACYPV